MIRRALLAVFFSGSVAWAGDAIDPKYAWNLTEIYPSEAAWTQAKDAASADIPKIAACRGKLASSADRLLECLDTYFSIERRLNQVVVYAGMNYDLDTRVGRAQQMQDQARKARTDFSAATAWLRPELIAAGAEKIRALEAQQPKLAPYKQPLDDVVRRAPHTLDADAERIIAETALMANSGQAIRDIFVNADFPYPKVKLHDGQEVTLDAPAYTKYRAAADRADRLLVFDAFWSRYNEYTRTLGTALNAQVQAHEVSRTLHKFDSSVAEAMFADNVPTAVYTQLISDIHANLATLHRYLRLRQRMMGLDKLGYEDLYAPIVKRVERKFTPEEAKALTLEAVAALGPEYQGILGKGFETGWIDWFPRTGKKSGAYSTGAYGLHPFQLQNFTGLYEEVSTLAHESGHSMHTFLSDRSQPYPTHDYPTFVAEVASTLNENLLVHSMLAQAKNDDERLALLGSHLDTMRTTLFRQGLLAEFELRMHEMAQNGEPLNGENLTALYLKLLRQYYGSDAGVCEVKDVYGAEWAYIPHMYYDFYVYQYATSVIASVKLADGIRAEAAANPPSTARRDAYLKMLSAGSSRYAYDMLKEAGVDMATSAPFAAAMRDMNETIDAMESILDKRGAKPSAGGKP
jgi:oligoendopeptidase F